MAHVISSVVTDIMTDDLLFGLVVSDDDLRVIPEPPGTDADVTRVQYDLHRKADVAQPDAQKRMDSIIYNSMFQLTEFQDEPDGDFQTAVENMTARIAQLSEES